MQVSSILTPLTSLSRSSRRWRSQWRPSNSRWPKLAARTPSVTLCLAPGRGGRLRTLLGSVLRPLLLRLLPLLLLFCLSDFPSDTTVLDTLPSPMLPLLSPRLRSPSTNSSPRRRLSSCSPPVRMPGDSEYLVPELYLSKTVRLLVC